MRISQRRRGRRRGQRHAIAFVAAGRSDRDRFGDAAIIAVGRGWLVSAGVAAGALAVADANGA